VTRNRTAIAAVIGVASLATLATGVTAVASTTTHAAKACESSKHVLALEKKGKCPHGTSKVTLGTAGPRGKQGIQGKPGIGLPPVTYHGSVVGDTAHYLTGSYTSLASITVPAGSYVASWAVAMSNDAATAGSFQCSLQAGAATDDVGDNNIGADVAGTVGRASLDGTFAVTTTTAGSIALQCEATSGTGIRPGNGETQSLILTTATLAN
jgi:hypothetical protein